MNPLRSSERHRITGFGYDDWFDGILRATDGLAAYAGETGQEFKAWRESSRAELRDVLEFPAVRDSAVKDIDPRRRRHSEAIVRHQSYERRTWSVCTKREFRVLSYLLLPDSVGPPYPVAVTLHGHAEHGKDLAADIAKGETAGRHIIGDRQDTARQAARRGFAVVAPNMHALGELSPDTSDDSDSSDTISACTRWQKRAQLLGRSLVGECVWGVRRLIDFVGGHPTLNDRIGHVVACVSVCPFENSIVPIDHCLCDYVPDLRRLGEAWDVAGLVAPRPLRIVADKSNPIFPTAETRRVFDRIQGRHRTADAEREYSLFADGDGHRFFEAGAWPFLHNRL